MMEYTMRYDRPVWEGLRRAFKLSLTGKYPRWSFLKILLGIAYAQRKRILALARELDMLVAGKEASTVSYDDIGEIYRLLRQIWKMLRAYETEFGLDDFSYEVADGPCLQAQIWADQAEHCLDVRATSDEWERLEKVAIANIVKTDGYVSDSTLEYIRNRLEGYFSRNYYGDPLDGPEPYDPRDPRESPWEYEDYLLFGMEPPAYLAPNRI